jgi:hypothetical protein
MIDKFALCQKIKELYPDIGECGIDINVDFDPQENTWVVNLKKDDHELKTFLEKDEAEKCMIAEKCVGVGFDIAQLRGNIDRIKGLER